MHINLSIHNIAERAAHKLYDYKSEAGRTSESREAYVERMAYNMKQIAWNATTVALAVIATFAAFSVFPLGLSVVLGGAIWLVRQGIVEAEGEAIKRNRGFLGQAAGLVADFTLSPDESRAARAIGSFEHTRVPENWHPVALNIAGINVWKNTIPAPLAPQRLEVISSL